MDNHINPGLIDFLEQQALFFRILKPEQMSNTDILQAIYEQTIRLTEKYDRFGAPAITFADRALDIAKRANPRQLELDMHDKKISFINPILQRSLKQPPTYIYDIFQLFTEEISNLVNNIEMTQENVRRIKDLICGRHELFKKTQKYRFDFHNNRLALELSADLSIDINTPFSMLLPIYKLTIIIAAPRAACHVRLLQTATPQNPLALCAHHEQLVQLSQAQLYKTTIHLFNPKEQEQLIKSIRSRQYPSSWHLTLKRMLASACLLFFASTFFLCTLQMISEKKWGLVCLNTLGIITALHLFKKEIWEQDAEGWFAQKTKNITQTPFLGEWGATMLPIESTEDKDMSI